MTLAANAPGRSGLLAPLAGLTGSVGTVADALDDALAETAIGLVQDRAGTRVIW
jgi:hypothetical protein